MLNVLNVMVCFLYFDVLVFLSIVLFSYNYLITITTVLWLNLIKNNIEPVCKRQDAQGTRLCEGGPAHQMAGLAFR